jgi:hypothetical protein
MDSFGDGLCCASNGGEGSYELRTDNNTLITNYTGDFGLERSTTISTTTLGVSNYFVTNKFSLFPNPTSTDLKIKVRTINDLPDSILVFNMLGQTMISKKVSTSEDLNINTSNFSKGMYFVKIVKDNASIALPFIKK